MSRSPLRSRVLLPALGAACVLSMASAHATPLSLADVRTVRVEGHGTVTFELSALRAAEERIRAAAVEDRARVIGSLDPALARIAIWDMTYIVGSETVRGAVNVVRPCYDEFDCDRAIPNEENEPPADPPSSVTPPPPPPEPTCYTREDSRKLRTGWFIKGTAFTFFQRTGYCVLGQLVQPGPWNYSWYSIGDPIWDCQSAEQNVDIVLTPTPSTVESHSNGKCWANIGINEPISFTIGHAHPSITDTYGIDGSRIIRSGSSH